MQGATLLALALVAWMAAHALVALFITFIAVLATVALDQGVAWLERHGWPRAAGITAALVAWALVVAALVWLFVPPAVAQLEQLVSNAPQLLERLKSSAAYGWVTGHLPDGALRSAVPKRVGDALGSLVTVAATLLGGLAGFVTVFFVVAFMLASGRPLVRSWIQAFGERRREVVQRTAGKIYDSLGAYVAGLGVIVATNAALTSTFLGIVGVPWFLPLGLLSGLSSLVPYVGALVAGALLTLVAFAAGGLWTGIAAAAYVVVYQQLENHLLAPVVYRRSVHVNPVVILLSALFLAEIWGVAGAILAIPLAATVQLIAQEVLRERRPSASSA